VYETYWGLRERPFELTSNAHFLLLTQTHLEALSNLEYGAASMRGVTLLIGEAGTGKTTILRKAFVTPDRTDRPITCALVENPALTRHEFFQIVAERFGVDVAVTRNKTRFLSELRTSLLTRRAAGENCLVVIDEAQSLPMELFEEVRLLGNMESATERLLAFVLAGQPELAARLALPALRPLKQRIGLRYTLASLTQDETAAYIAARIRIAGGEPAWLFSREAVAAVYAASRGVPRTISVVCDNALLTAFARGRQRVDRETVEAVAADFELTTPCSDDASGGATNVRAFPSPTSKLAWRNAVARHFSRTARRGQ
jgi:general secretion pathway protein A